MKRNIDLVQRQHRWLLSDRPEHIADHIRKMGYWGNLESSICSEILKRLEGEAPIVIDAGANIGGFTVPVGDMLREQNGKVYSFEPQRIIFQQLCANVFINGLENVHCFNLALGDKRSKIEMNELDFSNSTNIGRYSLDPRASEYFMFDENINKQLPNSYNENIPAQKIDVIPLDELQLFSGVSFIKVDVEGAELNFFKGAIETIQKNGYPPIFFELLNFEWFQSDRMEIIQLLSDLGYDLTELKSDHLAQHPDFGVQLNIALK